MATTFDDIQIRRSALATSYLELIDAQPGRPLAMFAPRRVGKTHFLDNDLAPAAQKRGWLPVYADLWILRGDPLSGINHALEEALDDVTVPASRVGRVARTPVKKVAALSASLELGDEPARRPLPDAPELRLDALVTRLAARSGKPVLLLLDEIQTLGEARDGDRIVGALRAVLHKRRAILKSVFTGSSQEAMVRMLTTAGAPMYQFAQLLDFPVLGDEYLERLAKHFASVHAGKRPPLDDLRRLYVAIGHKPGLLKDIVKEMSAEGSIDVDAGRQRFLQGKAGTWSALMQPYELFDRALLVVLADGLAPMGRESLERLTAVPGQRATIAKVRIALDRLRKAGLLARTAANATVIEDPLFAQWLRGKTIQQLS